MEYFFETEFDIEVAKVRYQLNLHLKQLKEEFKVLQLEEENIDLRNFISNVDHFCNEILSSLGGIYDYKHFLWVVDEMEYEFDKKYIRYYSDDGREMDYGRVGDVIKYSYSFFEKLRECLTESTMTVKEAVERLSFENLLEIDPETRIETVNKFYLNLNTKPERLRLVNGLRLRFKSHTFRTKLTEIEKLQFDKLDIFFKSCLELNRIVLLGKVQAAQGISTKAKRDNYKQLLQEFLDPFLIIHPFDNFLASEIALFRTDILKPRLKYLILPRENRHPREVIQRLKNLQTERFVVGGVDEHAKVKNEELKWWIFSLLGHHAGYSYDSIHKAFY